jgi:molecular chaperone GrpE
MPDHDLPLQPDPEPRAPDTRGEATAAVTVEAAEAAKQRDEYLDLLKRKTAEFDNFRKRVERERRDLAEWAAADVLTEVLAVMDDFERALTVEAPPEAQAYRAGIELIHRQLQELVRKRGATAIDSIGEKFDPHVHQAVAYEETEGAREGEIVGELRKGYKLGDRLLRPAMVKVAKAS